MKTTRKSTIAALCLAILVAINFSGCASRRGGSSSGAHEMGGPKNPSMMSNESMPGGR